MSTNVSDPYGDQCVASGLLLPLVGYYSQFLWVRAIGYLAFLLYLFLGIAIIADIFMCSIEKITSKKRKILISTGDENTAPQYLEVPVWNDTVANLTLMALGSSAPEILLSIIEIVSKDFKAGKLGPGTIVGSAAFNLMIISAVCVVSLPGDKVKRINAIKVFMVTTFFSIFAYLWLYLILVHFSPDEITVTEAALTFLYFPLLVITAYAAEKDFFMKKAALKAETEMDALTAQQFFPKGKLNKKSLARFIKELKKIDPSINDEDAACLAATYLFENEHHSRLFYRVSACRYLTGSRTPFPHLNDHLQMIYDKLKTNITRPGDGTDAAGTDDALAIDMKTKPAEAAANENIAVVQFSAPTAVVLENAGRVEIGIERFGRLDNSFKCLIETLDRTAKSNRDYKPYKGVVNFEPNETHKKIDIEIIDDDNWNPDNVFLVKLSLVDDEDVDEDDEDDNNDSGFEEEKKRKSKKAPIVAKGRICMMTVTIVDDDRPGIIAFGQRLITIEEDKGKVLIPVLREQGADGEVVVKYTTVDGTARNGIDFKGGEGELVFAHGVIRQVIEIPIVDDFDEAKDEYFEVKLLSVTNNAKIGKIDHIMVTVTSDDDYQAVLNRLLKKVKKDRKSFRIHKDRWIEQFKAAITISVSDDEGAEDGKVSPSFVDYVLHILSFGWKIIFACVPPTSMYGGWLTFIVSLILIGIITAIVGDAAEALGCLIGLEDSITAITLVALGTSLPDTFASRTAARMEKYADNAIGNITGSNSVNVFLGLGLPWLLAAIKWSLEGKPFTVKSGSLSFSVGVYTVLSLVAIITLVLRRYLPIFGQGEIGGPRRMAMATAIFLSSLWFVYIGSSVLQVYKFI